MLSLTIIIAGSEHPIVTMDLRLGARDKYDSSWKEIAKAREQREHKCTQVKMVAK